MDSGAVIEPSFMDISNLALGTSAPTSPGLRIGPWNSPDLNLIRWSKKFSLNGRSTEEKKESLMFDQSEAFRIFGTEPGVGPVR